MNNDAIATTPLVKTATQETLEINLIHALTRLRHTAFEKEILGGDAALNVDAKPESFFGFSIGHLQFMVAASCFCEVFVDTAIAAVPNAPSTLVGLSNIRGVLMPIYQLHSLLNSSIAKKPIIFAIGKGESSVGLLIDSLPVSLSLAAYQREAIAKQESPLLQQLVKENYFANQSRWLLLDGKSFGAQLLAITHQMPKQGSH
ncbi:hypothetical protein GCM10011613_20340 [Cellvibrio zantedeschiae]|uniref:CheW-like domain-containing protein n=1 Tax=Cellvibrio zantedeschiae TaxID=1237077 RepID=A0ABQ3B5X9_9GAMM|nr:chemotaxis protein CheW [Cellvibrio zantedeschiae]GGY74805.1 hypothetical protein GCM10011613_20340 [Cellvibrio zantedeschiae]